MYSSFLLTTKLDIKPLIKMFQLMNNVASIVKALVVTPTRQNVLIYELDTCTFEKE